jgi:7,8-dihydropterin-6-yl-methyl-4-(beta-D-ribofuranosyl)aminobenzene 5'-phosphate synthase
MVGALKLKPVDRAEIVTLADNLVDQVVPGTDTIDDLKAIGADFIIPTHCTGWESSHRVAQAMPEAFILNTVGSVIHFG